MFRSSLAINAPIYLITSLLSIRLPLKGRVAPQSVQITRINPETHPPGAPFSFHESLRILRCFSWEQNVSRRWGLDAPRICMLPGENTLDVWSAFRRLMLFEDATGNLGNGPRHRQFLPAKCRNIAGLMVEFGPPCIV